MPTTNRNSTIDKHRSKKSNKKRKFRLLLDAAFARPGTFRKTLRKANITHVVFDYGLSPQCSDEEIYRLATKENRFVITIDHDFKKFVHAGKPGSLTIPAELSNEEIDTVLSNFLKEKNPDEYMGKSVRI